MDYRELLISVQNFIQTEPLQSALLVLCLILLITVFFLALRLGRLTRGANGRSLEGTIHTLGERVQALESYARKNQKTVTHMEGRLLRSLRGVSVERFDPFAGAGGQQSFATALINEQGNGLVLSGIHSRDGVRVYAKPVSNFTSERELSEEETKAIADAKRTLS